METIYELSAALPLIPVCSTCGLIYNHKWMTHNRTHCFFCSKFRTNVSRYYLLQETDWFYIQSGEDHREEFYQNYFQYLHRWSDRFQLPHTTDEKVLEQNLLSTINK